MTACPGSHRLARRLAPVGTASVLATWLAASGPALAHPHIFIDAGLTLVHDAQGVLTEVHVTWRYDELYTLLILDDYGLDPDFDGVLTEDEVAATLGFDLNWGAGFEGGLTLMQDGRELQIGAPRPLRLELLPEGQLQTTHMRPVAGHAPGPVEASVYDREFYIAFEMTLPMEVEGRTGCAPDLVRADLDAAYAALEAEMARIGGAVAAEDNFPQVGALFADRVMFSCAPD